MQKFDVYSALLAETDNKLKENQRTTFVVFHQSGLDITSLQSWAFFCKHKKG